MNQQGNTPQNPGRQRRVERYAGEFLHEPSMSAPQPIPQAKGARKSAESRRMPVVSAPQKPAAAPEAPGPEYAPQGSYASAPQGWSQSYPAQQTPQGWSQSYPAQQMTPQGWSQSQPAQQAAPQGWSQSYPAQQATPQGWSQSYPAQQMTPQGWSQSYPAQQMTPQGWSQSYPVQPGAGEAPVQPWNGGYVPPVSAEPPRQGSGSGSGGSGWWKWALLGLLALVLLVGAVVGLVEVGKQTALHNEVAAYNNRFCEGVYVDGIHLGGMTQEEAIAAVEANAQERLSTWQVSLTYGGRIVRTITAADLGMTVNVNDALAEAWEQGHASSDVAERKAAMDDLLVNPYYGYTAMPSGDTSAVDVILYDLAAPVYRPPQNATVTFDPEAHSYPFEYTPEVYGTWLDVEPIKTEIYGMVETMTSGSIELQPQSLAPEVTEAELRAMRTLRGTATTEISTVSTDARTGNIQRAFQLINGTVLAPGQSFSFNGIVGPRTQKNGFLEAIEFAYGNERMGFGGGVCQASTTIYLAAIRSDMTITHREPHSDKVNYTEYGLDATVNYDGKKIDLTFKNTTEGDVYVMAYLERGKGRWICRVDIYGPALPEGVTYDLIAETVEVLPAPVDPEYVEDTTGKNVVYIDETPVQKRPASDGYIVETFKVKYVNGKEVDRTFVARDTYKAKCQQLWVGIQERDVWGQ